MKYRFILFLLLLVYSNLTAQKKPIDSQAYTIWKRIKGAQLSNKGNLIVYGIAPQVGDQNLVIYKVKNDKKTTIERADKAYISTNEKWVSFRISNYYDSIRKLKLADIPKSKWITDSLGIYLVALDSVVKIGKVKNYKVNEEKGDWIAILRTKEYAFPLSKKEKRRRKKRAIQTKGKVLTLYNPVTGYQKDIENVEHYTISKNGTAIYWNTISTYHDTIDSTSIYRLDTKHLQIEKIAQYSGTIKQLTSSWDGKQFAYMASSDTGEVKIHKLFYWNISTQKANLIVDTIGDFFAKNKSISIHRAPYFSENGAYLYFGIGNKPQRKKEDTLTKDEKYHVDIWSWTDKRLQPQQLKNLDSDKKKNDLYVYLTSNKIIQQITDSTLEVSSTDKWHNSRYLLLLSQEKYLQELSWDDWYFDYYRVDVETGEKILLKERHKGEFKLSPSGKNACFYALKDSSWYNLNIEEQENTKVTHKKVFHYKDYDLPGMAYATGIAYWTPEEKHLIIQGQYDYWKVAVNGTSEQRLTKGRENNISFSYWKTNTPKNKYINDKIPLYFLGRNKETMAEGIWKVEKNQQKQLIYDNKQFYLLRKAKEANVVLFRQMSFTEYPQLKWSDLDFKTIKTITNINPQQKEYNWGTVELIKWKSFANDTLKGLLYKPEDFDSTKKYPLIVYFYETNSHNLHRYYAPQPTASIVYPTEYVSNGYLVFIPDVKYKVGHPAQGAYDCIVSGTDYLIKNHSYIDSTRIGIQGQSWGGYQVAQLITMTNKYKCAMAGAPVSNMFSAYGGIRWGSGLSRAFQYEQGQSRIGKTIWEAPHLYIENSPIFHLDKVTTPLLIMHNDGDGAVPWQQGIEMFVGLRRLQKPVWLLNYNNDEHNLRRRANREDLSRRMRQFFDYYLLDKPMPAWMQNGRTALEKEKEE